MAKPILTDEDRLRRSDTTLLIGCAQGLRHVDAHVDHHRHTGDAKVNQFDGSLVATHGMSRHRKEAVSTTDRVEESDGEASGGLSRRHALALGAAAGGVALAATLTDGATAAGPVGDQPGVGEPVDPGWRAVRPQHPGTPPTYFVVVDDAGHDVASARMDNSSRASLTLVPMKAGAVAAFRTATADLAARTTDAARIASFTTAGFRLLAGGRPISLKGGVVGALGVGGGTPEQDDVVAQAALRSV